MSAREIGEAIGSALGRFVKALGLGDAVRAHYAARFGTCRVCDAPLGGPSPSKLCTTCHADILLQRTIGDRIGGDA